MPEPTTDPPQDMLVAILSEQISASERQTEAIGSLGRLVTSVERSVESAITVFAGEHGKHEAGLGMNGQEMRKIHQSLDMLIGEVRGALKRLGPLELEVAHMREERLALHIGDSKRNGNGNGNGGEHGE